MSATCFELHKYLFYIPKLFTPLNTSEQNRVFWIWGESPLSDGVSWIYPTNPLSYTIGTICSLKIISRSTIWLPCDIITSYGLKWFNRHVYDVVMHSYDIKEGGSDLHFGPFAIKHPFNSSTYHPLLTLGPLIPLSSQNYGFGEKSVDALIISK